MDVFECASYKASLREKLKEIRKKRPHLTLKRLASTVPVQYTYLSRVLRSESSHLNEDHLFSIARTLEFTEPESDFLLLQRNWECAQDLDRKSFLSKRIESLKRERRSEAERIRYGDRVLEREIDYLGDPLCIIIENAVDLPGVKEDPYQLCSKLGVSRLQMRASLKRLEKMGILELDERSQKVLAVHKGPTHYLPDHPLTRVHQNLAKTVLQSQMMRASEDEKHNFSVVFTTSKEAKNEIEEEFSKFLNRVQDIVRQSKKNESLYQMNFDFLRWI